MAKDPLIPNFTPSVAVPVVRRQPKGDPVRGEWNLEGVQPHRGANLHSDALMPKERRVLLELVRAYEQNGLEKGYEFSDALAKARTDDDPTYWLTSLMVKLEVNSVMALIQKAEANPDLLKAAETGGGILPSGVGMLAPRQGA